MSRLVDIDPATKQEDEPPGCEFGYYLFDPLPPIEVNEVSCITLPKITVCDPEGHELVLLNPSKEDLKVQDLIDGLEGDHYEVVAELQALDPFCKRLMDNLKKGHLNPNDVYYIEGDTLKRRLTEDGKIWGTIVLPKVLIEPMMFWAHNMLGHNGTTCTYSLLCQLYFWKGMKNSHRTLHMQLPNLPEEKSASSSLCPQWLPSCHLPHGIYQHGPYWRIVSTI